MIPNWLLFIYLGYGIPCLILYFVVVFVLIQPSNRKVFKSSFFTIAIVMAFMDISSYILNTIFFKFPLSPIFGHYFYAIQTSYILVLSQFFQMYFVLAHSLLVTLTALNRMTSMAFPRDHEKLWEYILIPGILASLLLSIVPIWHLPFSNVDVILFNDAVSSEAYVLRAQYDGVSTAFNQSIAFFVIAIAGLLFNMMCIGFLLKMKALTGQKQNSRTEIRLVFVSLWDFILELLFCIHQIFMYVLMEQEDINWPLFDTFFLQIPWLFDMINLCRPFFLLLMSQQVRSSFSNLGRIQKIRVIEPTAMPSSSINQRIVKIAPSVGYRR